MTAIPAHATLRRRVTITCNDESRYQGQTFTLEEWRGASSDGYKTNYRPRPASWLRYILGGRTLRVMRYSGQNLAHVDKQFADMEKYRASDFRPTTGYEIPDWETEDERCQCGNTHHDQGFWPCDETGHFHKPNTSWPGYWVCGNSKCRAIITPEGFIAGQMDAAEHEECMRRFGEEGL